MYVTRVRPIAHCYTHSQDVSYEGADNFKVFYCGYTHTTSSASLRTVFQHNHFIKQFIFTTQTILVRQLVELVIHYSRPSKGEASSNCLLNNKTTTLQHFHSFYSIGTSRKKSMHSLNSSHTVVNVLALGGGSTR